MAKSSTFGKYTLLRKLAVGGMAEVFLARADGPLGFQKRVVLKRILPHFADDQRFVDMFLGEARLAAQLSHPNLVQIFDFGQVDGQYFLAMEHIDGPNLRALNLRARQIDGPLPVALAARIVALAAEGLHSAHELRDEQGQLVNLVHRDISPDNILVSRNGAVKVVDFGIAKAANQPHLTRSGMIKGKMAYMPPEQLSRGPLDRRSDLFALGIVLYELVTGAMPFDATSEVSIIQAILGQQPLDRVTLHRPDVPPALDDIIARCLEKSAERRYPDGRALQLDLERFIQSTGHSVGTAEISAAVTRLFPAELDAAQPLDEARDTDEGFEPTAPSRPSAPDVQGAGRASTGLSHTQLRAAQGGPSRALLLGLGALVVALAAFIAGALLWPKPPAVTVNQVAPLPPDAAVAVAEVPDAATAVVEDAGADVLVVVVEEVSAVEDAGGVAPGEPRKARLELRVRPYATVYLDGRELGDTPLEPQLVPVGRHVVRLVNEKLGKDVEVPVVVTAPETIFKHNLKE